MLVGSIVYLQVAATSTDDYLADAVRADLLNNTLNSLITQLEKFEEVRLVLVHGGDTTLRSVFVCQNLAFFVVELK